MIPQSFIQDLLARIDIVDVIGRHITLKKGGANYFACCPFHGEKTASFSVSPAKQFYHCFGCGAHGTAIGFLMEHNGLSYVEAIRSLAAQIGLSVPEEAHVSNTYEARHETLYSYVEKAARFYKSQLKNSPHAVDYLKRRGVSGDIAARFGLGYAPDEWQSLEAPFSDYHDKALLETGLVIENEQGRRYDRFRDRIMFPIQDRRGRVIGFGGRVLDSGEPKYLNSPETALFEKGHELYGLFLAQKAIRKEACVIVVEGYMDVVALAQFGIEHVVATLGTATTPHHIQLLLKQCNRIIFCFDGDRAGRKAAWRALETSLDSMTDEASFLFLFLPSEHDPDSYVRKNGLEGFQKAVQQALPLGRFLLQELTQEIDLTLPEGRAQFIHAAKPFVLRVKAPLMQLQLLKEVAVLGQISQSELEAAYGIQKKPPHFRGRRFQTLANPASRHPPQSPSMALLDLVLQHPEWATRLPVGLVEHGSIDGQALTALIDAVSHGELSPTGGIGAILEFFRNSEYMAALDSATRRISEMGVSDEVAEKMFEDFVRRLHISHLDTQIQLLTAKLKTAVSIDEDRQQLSVLLREKAALLHQGTMNKTRNSV